LAIVFYLLGKLNYSCKSW